MEFTVAHHLCSLAAAVFLVTSLVAAVVRWFHMCRPYNREPAYYYPGRPALTLSLLSAVIVVPYVLFPGSERAWMLARAYFFPEEIYLCAVLLFQYFGNVKEWRKWTIPTIVMAVPAAAAMVSASLLSASAASLILFFTAILETFFLAVALILVGRWARSAEEDEYSNPQDFPSRFARRLISMGVFTLVVVWLTALIGSREAMALLHLALSVLTVLLLLRALHPNRHRQMEDEPTSPATPTVHRQKNREVVLAIRRVVEDEQAFLDPHLTLQDIADRIGTNRTYVARVFASDFGGFFHYVNSLRLDYAEAYRRSHPEAKMGEIIAESGFGSRSTYYSTLAKFPPKK